MGESDLRDTKLRPIGGEYISPTETPKSTESRKTSQAGHSYLTVGSGKLETTSDEKLASSAKQINKFVKQNIDKLNSQELRMLNRLQEKVVGERKINSKLLNKLPSGVKKTLLKAESALISVKSFITNRGVSDSKLMREVQALVEAKQTQQAKILEYKQEYETAKKDLRLNSEDSKSLSPLKKEKIINFLQKIAVTQDDSHEACEAKIAFDAENPQLVYDLKELLHLDEHRNQS